LLRRRRVEARGGSFYMDTQNRGSHEKIYNFM